MPPTLGVFARGVLLGLGVAVPIGPVNLQIAWQAPRLGFLAGFALGCGAVTVDVFYAVLTSVGMTRPAEVPGFVPSKGDKSRPKELAVQP